MFVIFIWSTMLFKSVVYWFFCLGVLSIIVSGILKSPTIVVMLSIACLFVILWCRKCGGSSTKEKGGVCGSSDMWRLQLCRLQVVLSAGVSIVKVWGKRSFGAKVMSIHSNEGAEFLCCERWYDPLALFFFHWPMGYFFASSYAELKDGMT